MERHGNLKATLIDLYETIVAFLGAKALPGSADAFATGRLIIRTVSVTVAVGLIAIAFGGLIVMESGIYNIAADTPHFAPTRWILQTGRTRAVQFHSIGIRGPDLRDPSLVGHGLGLYGENCQPCHGAPGVAPKQEGRGIDPHPPPLIISANNWTDPQLYWIVFHGLKLSGMPGFAAHLSERDMWAIVAFLRQIVFLSPADYGRLTDPKPGSGSGNESGNFISQDDHGFGELNARGKPDRGRQLLRDYGCISCHTIPRIGSGRVGPPLTNFAERQYIAGALVNVPANVVAWIMNPKQFQPNTDMPNLGVSQSQALDIAAYLYTLGDPRRFNMLRQTATGRP